ncbi:unnamed protein product [Blepharisma stoltei]|uniref:Uncharacterized protein n=1 Tax=Blepharisma stoltei TaxID=1481888 RepID=A0AAU9JNE3_9CILI|nr:unnamed protein product [Blepharisma stoltei]
MDPYSEKGLEEKIATIRATLRRLGNSLEEEDFDKEEISHSKSSQDSSISNSFNIPATFDALKNHIQESYTPDDHWEPTQPFEYEKEKNILLDKQLKEKDQKIQDLLFLQSDLKDSIERNTEDLKRFQEENHSYRQQLENLNNENNGLRRILDEKDIEIARNKNEIENMKREKEMTSRELERTKRQAEKVDGLLDEITRLKDLNVLLKSKDETKKESDNGKLINSYQQQLNVRDSQINELEKERLMLLKEIDRIKAEKSQSPSKLSRDFNYLEATQTRESTLTQPMTDRTQSVSSLCRDMMKIVGVSHRKDLYSKVVHLYQFHEKFKKDKKLLNNMTKLIIDCSPPNTFDKSPNVHQIWKWLTCILEEYMKIRQSPNQKVINELCEIFSAETQNLVEKVKDVIAENYKLKKSRSQDSQTKGRKLS